MLIDWFLQKFVSEGRRLLLYWAERGQGRSDTLHKLIIVIANLRDVVDDVVTAKR
jgi:hypothetical protein